MFDWLFNAMGCDGDEAGPPPVALPRVMINTRFISPNEQRLFHTLRRHYGERGHVLAQVALNRLLFLPNDADRRRRTTWQNRIRGRSVDFLIVDPKTLLPLVAIELDDKSHLAEDRQQRDKTVNVLCAAAGLRLVRVPGNVTVEELEGVLGSA